MRMSKKTKVILYVILTLLAVYFLFPFVYMFFSTFKTESEAVAFPPKFLPDIWNWQNYVDAWNAPAVCDISEKFRDSYRTVGAGIHGIGCTCSLRVCKISIPGKECTVHVAAFYYDDSVGCYDDPTVYGVQRIWMAEYFKATDYSVLVRISILYLPDAPVLDGRAERF